VDNIAEDMAVDTVDTADMAVAEEVAVVLEIAGAVGAAEAETDKIEAAVLVVEYFAPDGCFRFPIQICFRNSNRIKRCRRFERRNFHNIS